MLDHEIELALLTALIKDSTIIYSVGKRLSPEMFSSSVHAVIYKAIQNVVKRGVDIDLILLKSELMSMNQFEETGADAYLTILDDNSNYKLSSVPQYIEKVHESFKRRLLISVSNKIPKLIENYGIDAVITKVNQALDRIVENTLDSDTIALGEGLDLALEGIRIRMESGDIAGISTGFVEVDEMTGGYYEGEVWYVGARPSMGKTTFLLKSFLNVSSTGTPCLLFSKEMNLQALNNRILSTVSGINSLSMRAGTITPDDLELLEKAKESIKDYPLYLDSNFLGDIDYIEATIRRYHHLFGIKLIGLDYIQLLAERSTESTHELGRISRRLKLLANELGLTVVILSQVNRSCELREDKRPLMADLRQSGNLEEDADLMVALYREDMYIRNSPREGVMEFIIRKARNGPIGTIDLKFLNATADITGRRMKFDWNKDAED